MSARESGNPASPAADTLGMTPEEMHRLGYKVVDLVVAHLCGRDAEPAVQTGDPATLAGLLGGPLPSHPGDPDEALNVLVSTALSNQQHGDHPRYFARVPGPSSFAAILGDWLGIGFNTIATSWVGGSGPSTVEVVTLNWLREFVGLTQQGEGILVSGGSIANLTALAAAEAVTGRGIVYLTNQAHGSVRRALRILGYRDDDVSTIDSDLDFRMPIDRLVSAMNEDVSEGRRPAILIATAGTTNTGAVDPIGEMADIAASRGLWLHVDGAYGATAAACEEKRPLFRGLERADSVVIDPHKWLFQPYGLGCVLMREAGGLARAFAMSPEYLKDTASRAGEPAFGNWGPELTRRARSLKLWMAFKTYGAERLRAAIRHGIELAEYAEDVLRRDARLWEVVTPAQLGIVTFALRGATASRHDHAARSLSDSGLAAITTTTLGGRSALRLCILNPLTTRTDIDATLAFLSQC